VEGGRTGAPMGRMVDARAGRRRSVIEFLDFLVGAVGSEKTRGNARTVSGPLLANGQPLACLGGKAMELRNRREGNKQCQDDPEDSATSTKLLQGALLSEHPRILASTFPGAD
jgi:hypothetical protein